MALAEKRTQVYFPADLYRKAKKKARTESRSFASVVRDAVEKYVREKDSGDFDWDNDPFFKLSGITDSGLGNLSEKHDKYLYKKSRKK
ncbi:MAG: hypothetical protein C0415_05650 [Thermodesulfovibrio sp.]|nr:hypothetical protein [Thermodesulfovibrio sp.]